MEMVRGFLANQTMRGLSPATVKRRRWTLTRFAASIEPRTTWTATTIDVESFISIRRTPATRRALLGDIRAMYRWAISRNLTEHDPTSPIETPKVPRRLASPLSRDELAQAWDAADFRMRCIIGLGAGAGLRVSEIAALEMTDLDFVNGVLTVRNGKGGIDRAVPMATGLAELLRHAGPDRVIGFLCGESVSDAIREHFRRCGVRNHRPHDLRHSFATEMARLSGGNMPVVARLLGHASIATTERYTAALPGGADLVERLWAA